MTHSSRGTLVLLTALTCVVGSACQLRRPDVIPVRMLEPQFPEVPPGSAPAGQPRSSAAIPLRLLDTQARSHIGRALLHQRAGGELIEDPTWRWSSTPDRYLDSALRLALASTPTFAAEATEPMRFTSQQVELPTSDRFFPEGPGAEAANNNCLACHSAGMVLTQPKLSKAQWTETVNKMVHVYKAPIDEADVKAIVDYLAAMKPQP